MPILKVKDAGEWKNTNNLLVKYQGVWVEADSLYVKQNGEWVKIDIESSSLFVEFNDYTIGSGGGGAHRQFEYRESLLTYNHDTFVCGGNTDWFGWRESYINLSVHGQVNSSKTMNIYGSLTNNNTNINNDKRVKAGHVCLGSDDSIYTAREADISGDGDDHWIITKTSKSGNLLWARDIKITSESRTNHNLEYTQTIEVGNNLISTIRSGNRNVIMVSINKSTGVINAMRKISVSSIGDPRNNANPLFLNVDDSNPNNFSLVTIAGKNDKEAFITHFVFNSSTLVASDTNTMKFFDSNGSETEHVYMSVCKMDPDTGHFFIVYKSDNNDIREQDSDEIEEVNVVEVDFKTQSVINEFRYQAGQTIPNQDGSGDPQVWIDDIQRVDNEVYFIGKLWRKHTQNTGSDHVSIPFVSKINISTGAVEATYQFFSEAGDYSGIRGMPIVCNQLDTTTIKYQINIDVDSNGSGDIAERSIVYSLNPDDLPNLSADGIILNNNILQQINSVDYLTNGTAGTFSYSNVSYVSNPIGFTLNNTNYDPNSLVS